MTKKEQLTAIKTIRIDGVETEIKFVKPREVLNGDKAWGMWHGDKNIIEICSVPNVDRQIQVLLHEIIHAIDYHRCYNVALSETQVQSIATGLLQVMFDNPDVARLFIVERLDSGSSPE